MYAGLSGAPEALDNVVTGVRDRPVVRILPYDHVASFDLVGRVGQIHEDVINVGVEGVFVAVAVGYGLERDAATPTLVSGDGTLGDATLADLPPHTLMDGVRINPAVDRVAFPDGQQLDPTLDRATANRYQLLQTIRRDMDQEDLSFLFNIVDSGSGRELQNAPIQNVAGLGKANGERPFRTLARPLSFLPRSSVRIQVEEQSRDVRGRLQVVLHGYKILGAAGIAEDHLRTIQHEAMERFGQRLAAAQTIRRVESGALPSQRIVPFDYVGSVTLSGVPRAIQEVEVNVNVEGGFVATSIGYSLAVEQLDKRIDLNLPPGDTVDVGQIPLTAFPSLALRGGFRIRQRLLRIAFSNGRLARLPRTSVEQLFEPLNLPDRVEFRYSIEDTGTGRAWQNEPVHNVAGLGIANGDRPFRSLAWPMHFLPRSTIRLRVEEVFGRGRLFVVFQGFKTLSES